MARKRLNLLRKLVVQIEAVEAELSDEEFLEDVREWCWRHHTGVWMLTLRDGAKELAFGEGKASIAIGEISNLVEVLRTVRSAVLAGKPGPALEAIAKPRVKIQRSPQISQRAEAATNAQESH